MYDQRSQESIVVSAWGERTDWYRNIRAEPALEVRTGRARYVPQQRFLNQHETYAVIADYERRHPWLVKLFAGALKLQLGNTREERMASAARLRMVGFRPRDEVDQSSAQT